MYCIVLHYRYLKECGFCYPRFVVGNTQGVKVLIKAVSVAEARAAQMGHGGWSDDMVAMLGQTGIAELIDDDGDVLVTLEDSSFTRNFWNPDLLLPGYPL